MEIDRDNLGYRAELHFDGTTLRFMDPSTVITASTVDEVVPALMRVEKAVDDGHYAVGFMGYEAAPAFDSAFQVRRGGDLPLVWFGIYDAPRPLIGGNMPIQGYEHGAHSPGQQEPFRNWEWSSTVSEPDYTDGVRRIREAIAGGYTYQVNYTMRLRSRFAGDDYAFFRRLCRSQQAPYSAYLNIGRHRILSVSPELFFARRGNRLMTRPMKGTAARGRWVEEDDARRRWLQQSVKNRAENLMIVDLLRNDVGRIASTGSVKVDELFRIDAYPTVLQMTSTVSADLRPGTTLTDIFRALFPCGSVTGAPKISTMGIIADLEPDPRGVYCGAIGYVAPGGDAVFNVAIRTVTVDVKSETAEYGTGGGITWDSEAVDEFREASTKAAILTDDRPDFDLLETLCLRDGAYELLERHIERLTGSLWYFGWSVEGDTVLNALEAFADGCREGAFRVRLLVSKNGTAKVEGQPLSAPIAAAKVSIARDPIDRRDVFLYHKTTHRRVYEPHKQAFPDAFDVLLWNERGEATEFTIGNLVVEIDGRKYTPPIECGLLPGTMRAELLARGEVEERAIRIDELKDASRIWLVNSVRGWVEVGMM
jgi:para-aminobenzoate synthetase/4-amino-4-deoxychorismate lyase